MLGDNLLASCQGWCRATSHGHLYQVRESDHDRRVLLLNETRQDTAPSQAAGSMPSSPSRVTANFQARAKVVSFKSGGGTEP